MYVQPNYRTKKLLREAVGRGDHVTIFSPGPFPAPSEGVAFVEGPHYPKPHTWYAKVLVAGGRVTKVLS